MLVGPQALAAQLTLGGWPLLASAGLIAANAGLINHALANGLLNGVLCAEFYWTVSVRNTRRHRPSPLPRAATQLAPTPRP